MAERDIKARRRRLTGAPRVTLADVARESGLSTATISRVLNAPDQVTRETRARVAETIGRLGYVPHGVGQALALQRTRTVGAIIPTIENSFFAKAISAFQRRLGGAGYSLLLATTDYDLAAEGERVRTFITKGVDALMLIGEQRGDEVYRLLEARGVPFVNAFVCNPGAARPTCGFDHAQTIGPSVEHLADLGHRDLGMIIGDIAVNDRAASRLEVARATAARRGMAFRAEHIAVSAYSLAEARRVARGILARPDRPTAMVCGNDLLAMGVLLAAQDLGIGVPGQLSVFGHGDFDFAAELTPALTTVRLPEYEIGTAAADYLLARMKGDAVADHICLPSQLVIRGTTAPPG